MFIMMIVVDDMFKWHAILLKTSHKISYFFASRFFFYIHTFAYNAMNAGCVEDVMWERKKERVTSLMNSYQCVTCFAIS